MSQNTTDETQHKAQVIICGTHVDEVPKRDLPQIETIKAQIYEWAEPFNSVLDIQFDEIAVVDSRKSQSPEFIRFRATLCKRRAKGIETCTKNAKCL